MRKNKTAILLLRIYREKEKTKKAYKTDDECLKKMKVKICSFLVSHVQQERKYEIRKD